MGIMQQISEEQLSRDELLRLKNNRLGLTLFQLSWILVFVCLVFVQLQIRWSFPAWPPPGVERLSALLPTLATLLLLGSNVVVRRGMRALSGGSREGFRAQWGLTLALGAIFIAIMTYEWLVVPDSGQYSMVFRVMTAFHAVHALAIGYYLWRVFNYALHVGYTRHNFFAVEAGVKLWDFVTAAWLLFFVVLYIL